MSENILEVKGLNISLGGRAVIENLSFDLKEKENLVILGPNGAGKTVLLRALLGLIPFQGSVKWRPGVKINYIPQRFFPPADFPVSVSDFLGFKGDFRGRAEKMLSDVGLGREILAKKISDLSAGQFQRLLIAWSLCDSPDVVILDEPTTGIDIGGEETIYNLLHRIEEKIDITMILVTHDLNIVYKFSDKVLCLNKKMLCYGSPAEILSSKSLEELYKSDIKIYHHSHE